ncbi:unnamed protein product, partial [Polarella glacialis]
MALAVPAWTPRVPHTACLRSSSALAASSTGAAEGSRQSPSAHGSNSDNFAHGILAIGSALLGVLCAATRPRRAFPSSANKAQRHHNSRALGRQAVVATATSSRFSGDDVVLVFDRNAKQACDVAAAVERDNAMAPRPVAFSSVDSGDASALVALAQARNLSGADMAQLTRPSSATAVLPSGALLAELELDPGPLLRELRYRTCLEAATAADKAALEKQFAEPLRQLRESWWQSPSATALLSRQLDEMGFVLIDGFLPEQTARRLKAASVQLYRSSAMEQGATTGGANR